MWDVAVWLDVFSAVKCGAVSSEFDASFLFSIHLAIYIVQPPCHNAVAARSYPITVPIWPSMPLRSSREAATTRNPRTERDRAKLVRK